MKLFDLTGKVAIITGSSRGIGRAIAEALVEAGACVVISSREQSTCEEVASAINPQYSEHRAIALAANIYDKSAQNGRAHARTPVTNALLVCRPLLESQQHTPTLHPQIRLQ